MMTFTKEHFNALNEEAAHVMQQLQEGKTAREVMAQMYVDNLEFKTMKQGLIMADEVLETLTDFNREFKRAAEDIGASMEEFAEKATQGKSAVERCNFWIEIYGAVIAINSQLVETGSMEKIDMEDLLKMIDEEKISEEEASSELEAELKKKAMEALGESGIMYNALLRQADVLEGIEGSRTAQIVLQMGENEIEYEAILSMIAYVKTKTGEFEEMPDDVTIDQVSVAIAAAIEQARIMDDVGKGNLTMEAATVLLKVLGYVVLIKLAIMAAKAGICLAGTLFGMVLYIPALLLIGYGLFIGIRAACRVWEAGAGKIVQTIGNVVCVSVKLITYAMRTVADYVKNTIVPEIDREIRKAVSFIKDILEFGKTKAAEIKNSIITATI